MRYGLPPSDAASFAEERRVVAAAHLPWSQACGCLGLAHAEEQNLLSRLRWHRWPTHEPTSSATDRS